MYANQYEEHITHSAYDHAEAFAGFDRGESPAAEGGRTIVGRMRTESGAVVEIAYDWYVGDEYNNESFVVLINGDEVSDSFDTKAEAAKVAHWWLDGCPR